MMTISMSAAEAVDCRVTISRPVVDYGRLVPGEEHRAIKGSLYPLEENDVVVSAFCSEPQKMTLFFGGNTTGGGFLFGDKGVLVVEATQALLDGKSVRLARTAGQGVLKNNGASEDNLIVTGNDGVVPVSDSLVVSGQQLQVTLKLKPLMNASGLKPADQTLLKSELTVRVESE